MRVRMGRQPGPEVQRQRSEAAQRDELLGKQPNGQAQAGSPRQRKWQIGEHLEGARAASQPGEQVARGTACWALPAAARPAAAAALPGSVQAQPWQLLADKDKDELALETAKQDRYLDIVGEALGDLTRAAKACCAQPAGLRARLEVCCAGLCGLQTRASAAAARMRGHHSFWGCT